MVLCTLYRDSGQPCYVSLVVYAFNRVSIEQRGFIGLRCRATIPTYPIDSMRDLISRLLVTRGRASRARSNNPPNNVIIRPIRGLPISNRFQHAIRGRIHREARRIPFSGLSILYERRVVSTIMYREHVRGPCTLVRNLPRSSTED